MQVKDLCNDYFWVMPKTPKYTDGASIPYITSKNLKNGSIDYKGCKYITNEAFDNLSRKRYIQEDDFLVSMIGTIGEVGIVHKTDLPIYGQNMYLLRPNYEIVDKRFLYHFLTSSTVNNILINIINGATQGYLHDKDIYDLKVPNYTIEHQKIISDELDSLRNIILLKQNELFSLDELIKSRFIEMFGDEKYPKYDLVYLSSLVKYQQGTQVAVEKQVDRYTEGYCRFLRIVDYMPFRSMTGSFRLTISHLISAATRRS